MNWLNGFVKPSLKRLVGSNGSASEAWLKDPISGEMVHKSDVDARHGVFPSGYHQRIGAKARAALVFDGDYQVLEMPAVASDPLKFRDSKRYTDRLKSARAQTDAQDALMVMCGRIGGIESVCAFMDFHFMGGSMGVAVGEGLLLAARRAVAGHAPLVVFTASGGARMQEGIFSLMQLPRTTIAVQMVQERRLPFVVVLCDPTTGGVSASFAMLGDIHIAEPGANIGFAGRRVIEQTVRQSLPDGFQTAEYLLSRGMVDQVVPREDLNRRLGNILALLTIKHMAAS